MNMNKNVAIALGGIGLFLIILGAIWLMMRPAGQDASRYTISMAEGEEVVSWQFKGVYTGNAELEAKARAEVERLEGLIGGGEHTDYSIYVSIANQHGLLGDGANELAYLERALAINATSTGLAWNNAGVLFERLGALRTARMAHERAAAAQPIDQYRMALVDFLKRHFPEDTAAIRAAEEATGPAELPQ